MSRRNHHSQSQMDSSSTHKNELQRETEDEIRTSGPASKRKENPTSAGSSLPSMPKKKHTSTRSMVCDHFTKSGNDENKCSCNYCGKVMCCAVSSGTSSLIKHNGLCKSFSAWKDSKAQAQSVLNPEGEKGILGFSRVSFEVFKEATNEMLVLAELPLAFIESLAWRHFCNRVHLYKPQSRRTSTREIVNMFVVRKAAMKKVFAKSKQRISLTTYIWVAPPTGASYMVITTHFIDASWKLRKLIIGFKNISYHKGATIALVLVECLGEWGIEKIFTITVDNATANTSALASFRETFGATRPDALVLEGEFMHVRCAAHIINLVVKDGLHDVDKSVSAIRNGVTYVRASTNRIKAFDLRVESAKVPRGSLLLDCKTRWNSIYLMLIRAIRFKAGFERMAAEDRLYTDYFQEKVDGKKRIGPPTTDDWEAVDMLLRFLIIFYNATLVVSATNSVGSYKCYNEIVTIERNLISLSKNSDLTFRIKAMAMRDKFDKHWEGLKEINRLVIIASVFDPRNKMKFATFCFESLYGKDTADMKTIRDSVISVMKKLFDLYNSNATRDPTSSQSAATSHSAQESQDPVEGELDLDLDKELGYERMDCVYKELAKEKGFQDATTELELYLKEEVENPRTILLGSEYAVLGWWKLNNTKFPVLSEVAKDVLAMQVISVASESAFSTSGRVLDSSRSCLSHYMLEVLMCTEQWLKCEVHLNEKGLVTKEQLLADIELLDKLQREFEGV